MDGERKGGRKKRMKGGYGGMEGGKGRRSGKKVFSGKEKSGLGGDLQLQMYGSISWLT